jgi:SAM-dependent methyltransferase
MNPEREEIRQRWRKSASYWNQHRTAIEQMYAPVTRALIEKAKIASGDSILDLAGGMGEPSLTIAKQFGRAVPITITDVALEMVAAAKNEALQRENNWIRFCCCSGDDLPFIDQSFSTIVSRFGIMFFSKAENSFHHMLRVLVPGGRVAVAVWHQRKFNPIHDIVVQTVDQFIPSEPEPPDAPGPFRYAQEGSLKNLMSHAGFTQVKESVIDFWIEAPIQFQEFWKIRSQMSDRLRDSLKTLSIEQSARLSAQLQREFAPYFSSGTMKIPAKIIIGSGRKNRN